MNKTEWENQAKQCKQRIYQTKKVDMANYNQADLSKTNRKGNRKQNSKQNKRTYSTKQTQPNRKKTPSKPWVYFLG